MKILSSYLRTTATQLYAKAVEEADPTQILPDVLQTKLSALKQALTPNERHWHCFGLGKAAYPMVQTTLEQLAPLLSQPKTAVALTQNIPKTPALNIECLAGDHPVPTIKNVQVGHRFIQALQDIPAQDPIVMLISGGGSSLLCDPCAHISFEAYQTATRILLNAGCDIIAINTVRKHLSQVKGGQMATKVRARPIFTLVISDVLGDDPSHIASGPLVADTTTFKDTLKIISDHQLTNNFPSEIMSYLNAGASGQFPDTPKQGNPCFENIEHTIIASNRQSVAAMQTFAKALGYTAIIYAYDLIGEARTVAHKYVQWVTEHHLDSDSIAIMAGGETTVTVTGKGNGGRNQELALAFALAMEQQHPNDPHWVFLSAGTDGRDGPTDAAGAIVDAGTLQRGRAQGRDPQVDLNQNNSYTFLKASGDLIPEKFTGTNVADVHVFLRKTK